MAESISSSVILNVNDTEPTRYGLTTILTRAGFKIIEAASGIEALAIIDRGEPIDLVVIDVNLGDMSGYEVCKKIKQGPETSSIPVLHVSATFIETSDKIFGLDMGADAFLTQPLEPDELVATVKALLRMRRAEREAREQEAKFRLLTEAMPQLVWTADAQGNTNYANSQCIHYTGMESAAKFGKEWRNFIHPDDTPEMLKKWNLAIESGQPFEAEYRLRRADGIFRWFLGRAVPARNESGKVAFWIGTATDVDDQKVTQSQLQILSKDLKYSIQIRDDFMSIASHELKTPLTSLKLQAKLRERQIGSGEFGKFSPEKIRAMIDFDTRQIQRLGRLVDDMLDVSRIQSGKLAMHMEQFDLCELVDEVVRRMQSQTKGTIFKKDGDCEEKIVGKWDRYRIEQILINLLSNAARYGLGKPVGVSLKTDEKFAILTVSDEGIGIAKENHERIFQRFERATISDDGTGLGLGLFIVQQIVSSHGGKVTVESELGKGSVFTVVLPLNNT